MQNYGANVRRQPLLMLGPPFLLFAICVALGVYGVVAGANQHEDDVRGQVRAAAACMHAGCSVAHRPACQHHIAEPRVQQH